MLTRDDIRGRKGTNKVHYDGSKEAVWTCGVEGIPRLGVEDVLVRRTKQTTRTWMVDGHACSDLDAALAVLNGTMTLEEAMATTAFKVGDRVQSPAGFLGRVTKVANGTVYASYDEKGKSTEGIYSAAWFDRYPNMLKIFERRT